MRVYPTAAEHNVDLFFNMIYARIILCRSTFFLFVFKFASSVGNVLRLCDYLVPPQIFT